MTTKPPQDTSAREIGLTLGKVAIVDAEDYQFLMRYKWHTKPDKQTFYAYTNITIGGKNARVGMHRLITGMSSSQIDHKNRNGLDNRKENLRFCSKKQNSFNRARKNKFGYRGVFKVHNSPNYSVQIQVNGKRRHAHGFKTPEDAARKYDEFNKELHGEFGIRNFKD